MNISGADFLKFPETEILFSHARTKNIELKFVGGCVRDAIIGRKVTDIDLATKSLPDAIMQSFKCENIKTYPTGIEHGTITVVIGEKSFEITTLREDIACFGRYAEVRYSTNWQLDAMRRDFTINALYADITGEVFDYTGGLVDIEKKYLRFIGTPAERIREDALRVLRFFRFAAELGFEMDASSLKACSINSGYIDSLSKERIRDEFFKLLSRMKDCQILQIMHSQGILQHILPYELESDLREILGYTNNAIILLALILGPERKKNGSEFLANIKEGLKLSNAQFATLRAIVENQPPETIAQAKKLLKNFGENVFRGVVLKHKNKNFLDLAKNWQIPEFPVKGLDLLALGYAEGEKLGVSLKKLEEIWELSDYTLNKHELLQSLK